MKVNLVSGSAEIYGLELKKNYPHYYSIPCSIPVFTWDSAEIKLEWTQYENMKNSEESWIDITAAAKKEESDPMIEYLELHYELVGLRKLALQSNKEGPRVAIIGTEQSASQNVSRLLLNYSGKYNMNPIFVDLDPESTIFIEGSIGALNFEYKILEDLYDRPEKVCFYYGSRAIKSESYFRQAKFLMDGVKKKINKCKTLWI